MKSCFTEYWKKKKKKKYKCRVSNIDSRHFTDSSQYESSWDEQFTFKYITNTNDYEGHTLVFEVMFQ